MTTLFNAFKANQKTFNASLKASFNKINEEITTKSCRISSVKVTVASNGSDLQVLREDTKHLMKSKQTQASQLSDLERKFHSFEQAALANTLEIHVLSQKPSENFTEIMGQTANSIGVSLANDSLLNIFRLNRQRKKNSDFSTSTIGWLE